MNFFEQGTMHRRPRFTRITMAAAVLMLGSQDLSFARTTDQPTRAQQETRTGKDPAQPGLPGQISAARFQLGLCDGTRKGSPRRMGAGRQGGHITSGMPTSGRASIQRARSLSDNAGRAGITGTKPQHGSARARARARDLSGTGSGPCAGTRAGSRHRAGRYSVERRR